MKKIFTILIFILFPINIKASNDFYTNQNGVVFSEDEYNFLSKVYWEGIQEYTTIEEYNNYFKDKSIVESEIETIVYSPINLFSTTHSTNSKTITIQKASTSNYTIIYVTVEWKKSPVTRSYDVIGANLSSINLLNIIETSVYYDNNKTSSNNYVIKSNGFGVSIKLPSSGSNIKIIQSYSLSGNGTIYASYQHAKSNITLTNSQKYSISNSGLGNVFLFDSSISSIYDGMKGVSIEI